MYIINTIPHGKCFVRYLRTRCFCIRNRTSERSERVRFLIRQQLVRKYRTPALSMKYSLFLGLSRNRPPGLLYPLLYCIVLYCILGDFGCDVTADVTCQACRENLPIALGSKPPLVTRIARTVLGMRLCIHHSYSLKLHREKERLLTT